ncbi:MAG: hypothetical protein ACRDLM_10725 [Gaiellaceae bacterium]
MAAVVVVTAIFGAASASTSAAGGRPGQLCDAALTRSTWSNFIVAFNVGNYQRLDALFARAQDFGWYSSNVPGLRNLGAAKNRATLLSYFRARHAQRDRMQLLAFAYRGEGNFTYRLRRSARDYSSGAWFRLIGKGAATCSGGTAQLVVVSLGGPGSG